MNNLPDNKINAKNLKAMTNYVINVKYLLLTNSN